MRISVECGGFTRAADACLTANQTSAVLTGSLAARLAGHAGMAGDDATSSDFARGYDAGARAALDALTDLTHAFLGAGRLLAVTGEEHAAAEAAAAHRVSAYSGGGLDDDAFVRVQPSLPPSSLGAQQHSLGAVHAWILDQVEGFVWPGADVAALRAAASDWRRAAGSTAGLADHVDAAVALLEHQRSPEVPLAVDALTDLGTLVGDTAWQLSSLATACEEYADAVEAIRERTLALLEEIAQMIVEGAAISVIVTGLTGGLGGGASVAAAVARVRARAPRFYALLTALRASVATATARTERVAEELATIRARVERFLRVPARNEAGSAKHPLGWFSRDRAPGWLRQHEVPPGHTIREHVGKSVDDLERRLAKHPKLRRTSTFDSQADAERLIDELMQRRAADIDNWAASNPDRRLTITEDMGERTGTSLSSDGSLRHPTGMRLILIPDRASPTGWRILTAFPD